MGGGPVSSGRVSDLPYMHGRTKVGTGLCVLGTVPLHPRKHICSNALRKYDED